MEESDHFSWTKAIHSEVDQSVFENIGFSVSKHLLCSASDMLVYTQNVDLDVDLIRSRLLLSLRSRSSSV